MSPEPMPYSFVRSPQHNRCAAQLAHVRTRPVTVMNFHKLIHKPTKFITWCFTPPHHHSSGGPGRVPLVLSSSPCLSLGLFLVGWWCVFLSLSCQVCPPCCVVLWHEALSSCFLVPTCFLSSPITTCTLKQGHGMAHSTRLSCLCNMSATLLLVCEALSCNGTATVHRSAASARHHSHCLLPHPLQVPRKRQQRQHDQEPATRP